MSYAQARAWRDDVDDLRALARELDDAGLDAAGCAQRLAGMRFSPAWIGYGATQASYIRDDGAAAGALAASLLAEMAQIARRQASELEARADWLERQLRLDELQRHGGSVWRP